MATGRKTGGRVRGVPNKRTVARDNAIRAAIRRIDGDAPAFSGDAYLLLCSIYKDPNIPLEFRIEAAKVAVRYERAPLAPIAPQSSPEDEASKAQRLHELLRQMRETVGGVGGGNGHASNGHGAPMPAPVPVL